VLWLRVARCVGGSFALTRRTLLVVADVALFLDARWKYASFALLNLLVVISVVLTAGPPPSVPGSEIAVLLLTVLPLVTLFYLVRSKRLDVGKVRAVACGWCCSCGRPSSCLALSRTAGVSSSRRSGCFC
jgi:hypothetical protein